MTRAGFEYILDKHVCSASKSCPSLSGRSVPIHLACVADDSKHPTR
jgi:hypothetical protein